MRDFDAKKREILDRVDLVDLVSEHVTLKRSGRRWLALCPFHTEKTPSFTVNPERGFFKCFGCGKGGDAFSFVQMRENISFIEALRLLADRSGVTLDEQSASQSSGPSRNDLARANDWAARFFRSRLLDEEAGRETRAYLKSRNISDEIAERFTIGLAPDSFDALQVAARRADISASLLFDADLTRETEQGRCYDTFRNRLIFPIRDATKRVVGFGGRTLCDDRAKYLNTRQTALFDKGRGLYAIDIARTGAAEKGRAVVVEGYTDCIAAHQAGFTETVATLGTALTDEQIRLLKRYTDRIILLFDSDQAGEAAADRAIRVAVPQCVAVSLASIPEGKDPADFLQGAESNEFSDLLNRAVDALEFKWTKTRKRFEGDVSDTHRREAVQDFLRVVAEATDSAAVDAIQRGLLVNQVAHLLQMNRSEVDHLLVRLSSRRAPRPTARRDLVAPTPATAAAGSNGGEQASWRRVLEVLLNDPKVVLEFDDLPDPDRIEDPRDRRIAAWAFEAAESSEGFHLADVLARCQDIDDAERVTELARRGELLGNYEVVLRTSLDRIRRAADERALQDKKDDVMRTEARVAPLSAGNDNGRLVSEGVRRHVHYAPRRMIRRTVESAPESSGANESTTTE